MVCDTAFISNMCIPCGKTFFLHTKVKVICQCRGKITMSHFFPKLAVTGVFRVSQEHIVIILSDI